MVFTANKVGLAGFGVETEGISGAARLPIIPCRVLGTSHFAVTACVVPTKRISLNVFRGHRDRSPVKESCDAEVWGLKEGEIWGETFPVNFFPPQGLR
jgi:hypothetical protein